MRAAARDATGKIKEGSKSWRIDLREADLRGVEPIGAAIEFEVMDILRIENGQIAERWAIAESHRLLHQLGAG